MLKLLLVCACFVAGIGLISLSMSRGTPEPHDTSNKETIDSAPVLQSTATTHTVNPGHGKAHETATTSAIPSAHSFEHSSAETKPDHDANLNQGEFEVDAFNSSETDLLATALPDTSPGSIKAPSDIQGEGGEELQSAPKDHPAHGPTMHPKRYNYNGTLIATIDPDRLLQVKPTFGRSGHKGKDASFEKADERLRFDSSEDWASLSDRLAIPNEGDVQISFEVEFDQQANAEMPAGDITVFWGAGGKGTNRRQGNSHSWTGYELKLGSPDREALAYKFCGHAIERIYDKTLFTPGQTHEVEITQEQGRMVLRVDGEIVLEQEDPQIRHGIERDLKDDGRTFGLMFYHAAGYIGPITIRRPESDA